jgi:iduronate 2-sulfatase
MTGLHPVTTGWYATTDLKTIYKSYKETLQGRLPMPTLFKNNGYTTLAAGKVFHKGVQDFKYPYWDLTRPADYGFRETAFSDNKFAPYPKDGGAIHQKYPQKMGGKSLCWEALEADNIPPKGMPDEQIADWAVSQLQSDFDKPFFMAVGFLRPHLPYTAPKRFFDLYPLENIQLPEVPEDDFSDIPLYGKAMAYGTLPEGDHAEVLQMSPTYWKEMVRGYLACISFVDEQVGKVIDALDASPYGDNTIIVLWSDHGQHLGEKKHWRKQCLWEEATRVPLFFSYPDMRTSNQLCNRPVSLLDIFPTLSALCNLPEQELDGVNIKALIDNPQAKRGKPVLTTRYYKNHSIRTEDWRYIQYRDGTEELYDHRTDPGEFTNVAHLKQHNDILDIHRSYLPKTNAFAPGEDSFPEDRYDAMVKQFKDEGIPKWLQ